MRTYKLSRENAISERASNGWLLKWRIQHPDRPNRYIWIKTPGNIMYWGGEAYAEILASKVCLDFNLKNSLMYKPCIVELEGTKILCCESNDFTRDEEVFVNMLKLFQLSGKETDFKDKEGFKKYLKTVEELTGLDTRSHLEDMLFLDYLICNYDRNIWNIGIIMDPAGGVREAPIFDSGNSFDLSFFEEDEFFREGLNSNGSIARPFCYTFDEQIELIRPSRVYKSDFTYTKRNIQWMKETLSKQNNKYGVANPIPEGSFTRIETMLEKNYKHWLDRAV